MTDIVERLRAQDISGHGSYSALVREAADEIALLREHNAEHEARYDALEAKEQYHKREAERLRAALEQMRNRDNRNGSLPQAYRTIINDALGAALKQGRVT